VSATPPPIAEAMKKADVVWIAPAGGPRPAPAWLHWTGEAAYVVCGPGEQPLPGLAQATSATVTVRSPETGASILRWDADVAAVAPGSPTWDEVVPALVLGRLNAADRRTLADRWARTATVLRLSPTGEWRRA
jgi:hypothetical protein